MVHLEKACNGFKLDKLDSTNALHFSCHIYVHAYLLYVLHGSLFGIAFGRSQRSHLMRTRNALNASISTHKSEKINAI